MANAAFTAAAAQDTATPVEVPSLPDDLACAQYSSTLRLVATATRSAADGIRVWSYTTGRIEHVLALIPPPLQPPPVQHSVAAVAAAAAAVAAAASALRTSHSTSSSSSSSSDHTTTTTSSSKPINSSAVLCMAFLDPYALLAVARGDGVLQLWCLKGHGARGACVLEWENRAPRGSSFYGEAKSDYPLLQPKVRTQMLGAILRRYCAKYAVRCGAAAASAATALVAVERAISARAAAIVFSCVHLCSGVAVKLRKSGHLL
jgi:hypothetical protein